MEVKKAHPVGERIVDVITFLVDWTVVIFFMIVILFCIYALYDASQVYSEAELPEEIQTYVAQEKNEEKGYREIDIDGLRGENSEISGWVTLDGTAIDYPILHTTNNQFYLSHDYRKLYSASGSVFIDWQNHGDWSDSYTLIYGHNMNGDKMFAPLKNYNDDKFFDENYTGTLYTQNGVYALQIVGEIVTDKNDNSVYNVPYLAQNQNAVRDYIANKATHKRSIPEGYKIVAFSTCHGFSSGMRQVVFAVYDPAQNLKK